ncbi:hypothetical protein [Streptomyces fuscichromogenes]|uniref:Prevent-host-death protein n=1 Tax=Streptomyces fuscichromogenes TaxID=1324013 RepID=A0A917XAP1_9ACTN|nr:hypothetical protein [Streptomyces fuscichromogenes]GGN00807.1 prevent-host-death protein [Streptomyces fuscichromogenes]
MATRRSSDLGKHSAEVFAEAEGRAGLLNLAAQLITVTLDDRGSLAERMSKAFPWMFALPSFSTGRPHLATAELTAWKETATAVAAGLSSGSTGPERPDDDETVERVPQPKHGACLSTCCAA